MNVRQLAALLIEDAAEADQGKAQKIDKKIAVYLNRVLLRHWNTPAFLAFLKDVAMFSKDEHDAQPKNEDKESPDAQSTTNPNSQVVIQLVYNRLPEEALPMLLKLLSAPCEPEFVRFIDGGQAYTGVQLTVSPDDFGGEDYDYAM
jgi:hypothetical protein